MNDNLIQTGEHAAVYFKYFLQFVQADKIYKPVPPKRIRATQLYRKNPDIWNKLVSVFNKHHLNISNYLKFLTDELKFTCKTPIEAFISADTLRRYQNYIEFSRKRKYAFDQFQKTVDWLSDFCISENISSAVECLRILIQTKRLATFYVCGSISRYYLSSIVNFDKIISKLDSISKASLADIKSKYEIYNTEINKAYLHYKNQKVNPFKILDNAICKKRLIKAVC